MVKMNNILKVSNIQRVCFHDGPGIRTTIFLSGCSLTCPWCANPENSLFIKEHFSNEELLKKVYQPYTIEQLNDIILKDKFLYGKDGGVTFSGGEPLIQSDLLSVLMKRLKENNVNIAVETCMYANLKDLDNIIDHTDLFIIDIKILNQEKALEVLSGNLEKFWTNIDTVFRKGKKVIFRIPLIYPYVTNIENLNRIYEFLEKYKPYKVEIFKGHNLGKEKYQKLGLEYIEVKTISDMEIEDIKNKIKSLGIEAEVISF